jgi:hypothetical protein
LGVWNGLIQFTLFLMGKFNSKVEPSPGTDCVRSSRFHCTAFGDGLLYSDRPALHLNQRNCVNLFFLTYLRGMMREEHATQLGEIKNAYQFFFLPEI